MKKLKRVVAQTLLRVPEGQRGSLKKFIESKLLISVDPKGFYPDNLKKLHQDDLYEKFRQIKAPNEAYNNLIDPSLEEVLNYFLPPQNNKRPLSVKNIVMIDDFLHGELFEEDSGLKALFPDATLSKFTSMHQATTFFDKLYERGEYVDLVISDSFNVGEHNTSEIISWFKEKAPDQPLPQIIFTSGDRYIAKEVSQSVNRQFDLYTYVTSQEEFFMVGRLLNKYPPSDRYSMEPRTSGYRDFIDDHLGITLPILEGEIDDWIIENNLLTDDNYPRIIRNGKINKEDGIEHYRGKLNQSAIEQYEDTISLFHGPDSRKEHEDGTPYTLMRLNFMTSVGNSAKGYAAFNLEQVDKLNQLGKKALLFIDDYDDNFIPDPDKISGVILLDGKFKGHMKQILAPRKIFGLIGQVTSNERYPFLKNLDGSSIEKVGFIKSENDEPYFISYGGDILNVGHAHHYECKEKNPNIKLEDVPIKKIDITSLPAIKVNFGDPLTLCGRELCCGDQNIEKKSIRREWSDDLQQWLDEWHSENNVKSLKFKANIDSVTQERLPDTSGIGLIRSEHLILENEELYHGYKDCIFSSIYGEHVEFVPFQHKQKEVYKNYLENVGYHSNGKDFKARFRLLDAPTSEFFSEEDRLKIKKKYGDKNIRGVQLAQKKPYLYESQLHALFSAYKELREEANKRDEDSGYRSSYDDFIRKKPEIMVPTVRTEEEILFVKIVSEEVAKKYDFSSADYAFGSMLETAEACNNITSIAKHCEFLSVGSNDLTEEVLGIKRGNLDDRKNYFNSNKIDPFVTLDPQVINKIEKSVALARDIKPNITIDLCGDHAEDIESIKALMPLYLDGVSVTPEEKYTKGTRLLYSYASYDYHKKLKF